MKHIMVDLWGLVFNPGKQVLGGSVVRPGGQDASQKGLGERRRECMCETWRTFGWSGYDFKPHHWM
jgi:hypothetical protein